MAEGLRAHLRAADVRSYVAHVMDFLAIVDDDSVTLFEKRQRAAELRAEGQKLTGEAPKVRRMVGRT